MVKIITAALFAFILTISFSTVTFSQDADKKMPEKKEMKKDDMGKKEMAMGPLKSCSCPSPCNFTVKSRNEKELVSLIKTHVKKMHKMDMTDKQVKEMIKTEEEPAKKD